VIDPLGRVLAVASPPVSDWASTAISRSGGKYQQLAHEIGGGALLDQLE
jgi:hypothetical protein